MNQPTYDGLDQLVGVLFISVIIVSSSASFSRYVSNHSDKVTAMVGRVTLELVRGNIVNEKTDVIVNTKNGSADQSGTLVLLIGGSCFSFNVVMVSFYHF